MKKTNIGISLLVVASLLSGCTSKSEPTTYESKEYTDGTTEFIVVTNPKGGETLSYSKNSGVSILEIEEDGITYAFKDSNMNGSLDVFEDWRENDETRVAALVKEMSKEQMSGLMLFSDHEMAPEDGLTERQETYLSQDHIRNVLNAGSNNVADNVTWSNQMQAYVEGLVSDDKVYVPVNFSSDPRNTAGSDSFYNADGDISRWPSHLGLAATFDSTYAANYGKESSLEYRALGLNTALGPQIDLASEPRWLRVNGTFGENSKLSAEFATAYMDAMQSTYDGDKDLGWGEDSINVMMKHFPGDGMGESGRESHLEYGKYAVYPGDNLDEHLEVFYNSGLALQGETKQTASVMTSYSVGIDADGNAMFGDKVATSYSKEKLDLLRVGKDYQGVICTDWGVTADMAYGMEDQTVEQRHYEIIKLGTDMFGGNNDVAPVLASYNMWEQDHKDGKLEISAQDRWGQTASRVLGLMFQSSSYDNPYLVLEDSQAIVGSKDKMDAGYEAQLASIVMLKNEGELIKEAKFDDYKEMTVYIPQTKTHSPAMPMIGRMEASDSYGSTMNIDAAKEIFKEVITDEVTLDDDGNVVEFVTPDLSNVDIAIVGLRSPNNGNPFSSAGYDDGYYPLSLQYKPYTADSEAVRKQSISGDTLKDGTQENRSYYGKTSNIHNSYDLNALENTVAAIEKSGKDIPMITILKADNAIVLSEVEPISKAIVIGFGVSDQALLEVALGVKEANGLLPIQMPKDMVEVEKQLEDVPFDMETYTDASGNKYDFGFGLNFKGVISDNRANKYK